MKNTRSRFEIVYYDISHLFLYYLDILILFIDIFSSLIEKISSKYPSTNYYLK